LAAKVSAHSLDKNENVEVEVDGEIPGSLPATFQILPKALRVRSPLK